jgi:hypothetical protein
MLYSLKEKILYPGGRKNVSGAEKKEKTRKKSLS